MVECRRVADENCPLFAVVCSLHEVNESIGRVREEWKLRKSLCGGKVDRRTQSAAGAAKVDDLSGMGEMKSCRGADMTSGGRREEKHRHHSAAILPRNSSAHSSSSVGRWVLVQ